MSGAVVDAEQVLYDLNPFSGERAGPFSQSQPEEVQAAVQAAREAQVTWEALGLKRRSARLQRLKQLILERGDLIAETLVRSTGKPLVEAYVSEWQSTIGLIDYLTAQAPKTLKERKIALSSLWTWPRRRSRVSYRPMGVVAVISPWNYPFCIPMGDIVTALITGCTVCLKPSEAVPAVGALIQELCHDAGLPVWVLQGDGKLGAALIDARPDKVIFTGGTEAGQQVMEAASRHLIPVVMELGGKDPMLVLEDAHLDNAASAAVWGCFTNSGQVCASVKRVYVVDAVADAFIERVKAQCEALRIGDPWCSGTDIGTLISQQQAQKGRAAVERALAEGARLLCGGEVDGCRMAPTVLVDVMPEMQVLQEEIFAPVLPIVRVPSAKAAVIHANNNPFALCASVFSREGAAPIAQQLRAGTVVLNDCTYTYGVPETPWGGVGRSGFGRMHGEEGMRECVYPFHQHVNHAPERRSLWWFPYDAQMIEIAKALGDFYGKGKKLGAFIALLKAGLLQRIRKI